MNATGPRPTGSAQPRLLRIRLSGRLLAAGLTMLLAASSGCAPPEPTPELRIRHQWITAVDQELIRIACPAAVMQALSADDPLLSIIRLAQRGRSLSEQAVDHDPWTPPPPAIAAGLDSMRAAVRRTAESFAKAAALAQMREQDCYGDFALDCPKQALARQIAQRIDPGVGGGLQDWFRHRAQLTEAFEAGHSPLPLPPACPEPGRPIDWRSAS